MRAFKFFVILLFGIFLAGSGEAREWKIEDFKALFLRASTEKLSWLPGELQIRRFVAEPEHLDLPDNIRAEVTFRTPPKLGPNSFLLRFFSKEGRLLATVRGACYLEAEIPVVVLKRPLPRHAILGPKDLALEKRPASRLPRDVITEMDEALGKRLRLSLRAGQILRAYALEDPPVIKRGNLVRIVARGKAFTVSALGEARQDGRPGEIIKVRNLSSKREVFAKVVDSKTVEVSF